jgi:uncharacterized coiled-coil protein SlyX
MDDRMVALEEKMAYLEKYLADLDGVVRGIYDELSAVRREVEHIRTASAPPTTEAAEAQEEMLEYEVPPHY